MDRPDGDDKDRQVNLLYDGAKAGCPGSSIVNLLHDVAKAGMCCWIVVGLLCLFVCLSDLMSVCCIFLFGTLHFLWDLLFLKDTTFFESNLF